MAATFRAGWSGSGQYDPAQKKREELFGSVSRMSSVTKRARFPDGITLHAALPPPFWQDNDSLAP